MLARNPLNLFTDVSHGDFVNDDQITLFEYAALSLDVYTAKNRPSLPSGWVRLFDSDKYETDYFGAVYVKNIEKPVCFAFAHRGTIPTSIENILGDLELAQNNIPRQCESAQNFYSIASEKILNYYNNDAEKIKKASIIHTGHSLGAILSESMCALTKMGRSITFENPGSHDLLKKVIRNELIKQNVPESELNIRVLMYLVGFDKKSDIYQSDLNLINSCNDHSGKTFRMYLPYNYYVMPQLQLPEDIQALFYLNFHYMGGYCFLDQHKIENIYNHIKNGGKTEPNNWPVHGFQRNYYLYLKYENRPEYWKAYINTCWDLNPEIHIKYEFNYNKFYQIQMRHLETVCKGARSAIPSDDLSISSEMDIAPLNNQVVINEKETSTGNLGIFASNKPLSLTTDEILQNNDPTLAESDKSNIDGDSNSQSKGCYIL